MRRNKLAENLTVAIVLAGASMYAVARMDVNDARTLPYQGVLEQGGAAANGDYLMRFGLFVASPSANELQCVAADNCPLWSEEQLVNVVNGRFSVLLGDSDGDLTDAVLGNNSLYLGMAVKAASDPDAFSLLDGVQEIAAAPWAARAAAARDFKVTGDVTVGGDVAVTGSVIADQRIGIGTNAPTVDLEVANGALRVVDSDNNADPDIARFFAQNLSQGVGIGYNRIEAVGSLGSQDLYLLPKGQGKTFQLATRNTDDSVNQTFWRSTRRYVAEATTQAAAPTYGYTTISEQVLAEMCGPPDGCTIRIGMRNWCGAGQSCNTSTSMGPFTFWYGVADPATARHLWRRSETLGSSNPSQVPEAVSATDGDGTVNHVLRDHNCYFTDGFYTEGTGNGSDNVFGGMGLLNWNNGYAAATCWISIDD